MKQYVGAKLHGLRVTGKSLDYHGSVTIPEVFCRILDIDEYEWIYVVNASNGLRWETYVLYGYDGEFSLNGGGARLGEVGDKCILFTKKIGTDYEPAKVIEVGQGNSMIRQFEYNGEEIPDFNGGTKNAR